MDNLLFNFKKRLKTNGGAITEDGNLVKMLVRTPFIKNNRENYYIAYDRRKKTTVIIDKTKIKI